MWRLIDARDPLWNSGYDDEFPSVSISAEEDLLRELKWYCTREPRMLILKKGDGDSMHIGLGGAFGTVKWVPRDTREPIRIVQADKISTQSIISFSMEGIDEEIFPENLLPADEVIRIAVHFFKTGKPADWAKWD